LRIGEFALEVRNAAFDEALTLLGSVVLGVLGQVSLSTRFLNRLDDFRTFHRFELVQFRAQHLGAYCGQRDLPHPAVPSGLFCSLRTRGARARSGVRVSRTSGRT